MRKRTVDGCEENMDERALSNFLKYTERESSFSPTKRLLCSTENWLRAFGRVALCCRMINPLVLCDEKRVCVVEMMHRQRFNTEKLSVSLSYTRTIAVLYKDGHVSVLYDVYACICLAVHSNDNLHTIELASQLFAWRIVVRIYLALMRLPTQLYILGSEPEPLLLETHGRRLCEWFCVATQPSLTHKIRLHIEAGFIGNVNCVVFKQKTKQNRKISKKPTPCYYC